MYTIPIKNKTEKINFIIAEIFKISSWTSLIISLLGMFNVLNIGYTSSVLILLLPFPLFLWMFVWFSNYNNIVYDASLAGHVGYISLKYIPFKIIFLGLVNIIKGFFKDPEKKVNEIAWPILNDRKRIDLFISKFLENNSCKKHNPLIEKNKLFFKHNVGKRDDSIVEKIETNICGHMIKKMRDFYNLSSFLTENKNILIKESESKDLKKSDIAHPLIKFLLPPFFPLPSKFFDLNKLERSNSRNGRTATLVVSLLILVAILSLTLAIDDLPSQLIYLAMIVPVFFIGLIIYVGESWKTRLAKLKFRFE